ncbi:hypothetical protein KIN20_024768 [Parelaphostrongylus tenuis]|uniref:Uncharacterized protein n=1 Tax=Parelaphostrongylus tenuis TaxID=148309 RepID=A0AAD5MYQ0_PARTN|nr:hypothetical protein KIN20_024768 [Parelaphostrongylus tenuis]
MKEKVKRCVAFLDERAIQQAASAEPMHTTNDRPSRKSPSMMPKYNRNPLHPKEGKKKYEKTELEQNSQEKRSGDKGVDDC